MAWWLLWTGGLVALAAALPYLRLGFKLLVLRELERVVAEMQLPVRLPEGAPFTDERCALLAGDRAAATYVRGGEDLALWRGGVALVAAGDLRTTFRHNASRARGTGVFAVDLRAQPVPRVRKLDLDGFPAGALVVGHGIYLSNRSGRVYLINHGDPAKSHVDIFGIVGSSFEDLRLRLLDRVSSDSFPYHGINDVVEGRDGSEMFVSQWRHFGSTEEEPAQGRANGRAQYVEKVKHFYLGPGRGKLGVWRCTKASGVQAADGGWSCSRTEAWGLPSANGLTISPDRRLLLVSCPECRQIFVYRLAAEGRLEELQPPLNFKGGLDNVEWDEATGRVFVPHSLDGAVELLAVGASGIPAAGGARAPDAQLLVRHDNSKLQGASAGVQYGDAVLLGSPFWDGLLYCRQAEG